MSKSQLYRLAGVALVLAALLVVGFGPMAAPQVFLPFKSAALTANANSASMAWRAGNDPDGADIFYNVVQGSSANTVTMKLQVSPDEKTWVDALTFASGVDTNTTSFTSTSVIAGLYARVAATVANTSPVTVTVWLLTH